MRITGFVVVVALASLTACQGWRQVERPRPGAPLEGSPEVVRVTRTMGCGPAPSRSCVERRGTITLYNPRVEGDSLIGYYDPAGRERVGVPIGDITNVEARKVDKLRTTGAAVGGTLVAAVVLTALALIAVLASQY
ncbi:MAG TPA: hypothetical protein VFS56_10555 [Gemmatimonadaceae bacterium]|nr:hypothetical protein [Gemmatimonadaceae bacterium]